MTLLAAVQAVLRNATTRNTARHRRSGRVRVDREQRARGISEELALHRSTTTWRNGPTSASTTARSWSCGWSINWCGPSP